eukprot:2807050-Rhodomonas_salina.3
MERSVLKNLVLRLLGNPTGLWPSMGVCIPRTAMLLGPKVTKLETSNSNRPAKMSCFTRFENSFGVQKI